MRQPTSRLWLPILAALLASQAGRSPAAAQETADYFRQNCMSCHTISGGRLVGPDLKGVTERKDRAWLEEFIVRPKDVLDSGDDYAAKLRAEAGGAVMPPIAGINRERARALLDLIEAESALEKSEFAGLTIGDEPFTAADVARGRALFTGDLRLSAGGPTCLSCHSAQGLDGLGGGRLGPDLTRVFERLQGRKNIAAWLQAPATEVMRPVYAKARLTNEEILPLVAFLEDEARQGGEAPATAQVMFLLLGLSAAVIGFVAADGIWRKRFRGVRRQLVEGGRR